jgi:hypothetical protein
MGAASGTTGLARNLDFALGPTLATAIWASSGYTLVGMRLGVAIAAGAAALVLISLALAAKIAATPSSTLDDSEDEETPQNYRTRMGLHRLVVSRWGHHSGDGSD